MGLRRLRPKQQPLTPLRDLFASEGARAQTGDHFWELGISAFHLVPILSHTPVDITDTFTGLIHAVVPQYRQGPTNITFHCTRKSGRLVVCDSVRCRRHRSLRIQLLAIPSRGHHRRSPDRQLAFPQIALPNKVPVFPAFLRLPLGQAGQAPLATTRRSEGSKAQLADHGRETGRRKCLLTDPDHSARSTPPASPLDFPARDTTLLSPLGSCLRRLLVRICPLP